MPRKTPTKLYLPARLSRLLHDQAKKEKRTVSAQAELLLERALTPAPLAAT